MCQFVSWIEHDGKNYFLTKKDLESKEGRAFIRENGLVDIEGHGAIRALYPELGKLGFEKECSNFSSPKNFHKDIVSAIKKGDLEGIGICLDVLNDLGCADYKKIQQPAWDDYKKIKQSAFWEIAKQEKYRNEKWH